MQSVQVGDTDYGRRFRGVIKFVVSAAQSASRPEVRVPRASVDRDLINLMITISGCRVEMRKSLTGPFASCGDRLVVYKLRLSLSWVRCLRYMLYHSHLVLDISSHIFSFNSK